MMYTLKTNKICGEANKVFSVYGIMAIDEKNRVITVGDIFFDKVKAERFVELCNNHRLSILHLRDVIDDVMAII